MLAEVILTAGFTLDAHLLSSLIFDNVRTADCVGLLIDPQNIPDKGDASFNMHLVVIPIFESHLVTGDFSWKIKSVFSECVAFYAVFHNSNSMVITSHVLADDILVQTVLDVACFALL